jgi:DNA replication and repair protein RecF
VRRRFLDELLVLRTPRLSSVITDYERVVRQRNTLLKSARGSAVGGEQLDTLEIWDERLVTFGSEIIHARSVLVDELTPEVSAAYTAVAGSDHGAKLSGYLSIFESGTNGDTEDDAAATTGVVSATKAAEAFRASLARRRRAELDRGITLVGPHRDDLMLELNGLPSRGYASHGESWSFALALKLGSASVLRRESSMGDPVLILDDVFAELDESRRARLALAVADFEQILITAAVLEDVPTSLAGHIIRIAAGEVIRDG